MKLRNNGLDFIRSKRFKKSSLKFFAIPVLIVFLLYRIWYCAVGCYRFVDAIQEKSAASVAELHQCVKFGWHKDPPCFV